MKKRQARKIVRSWLAGRDSGVWRRSTFWAAYRWCRKRSKRSLGHTITITAGEPFKAGQMIAINAEGLAVPARRFQGPVMI